MLAVRQAILGIPARQPPIKQRYLFWSNVMGALRQKPVTHYGKARLPLVPSLEYRCAIRLAG